jgi:hypothetical protein
MNNIRVIYAEHLDVINIEIDEHYMNLAFSGLGTITGTTGHVFPF